MKAPQNGILYVHNKSIPFSLLRNPPEAQLKVEKTDLPHAGPLTACRCSFHLSFRRKNMILCIGNAYAFVIIQVFITRINHYFFSCLRILKDPLCGIPIIFQNGGIQGTFMMSGPDLSKLIPPHQQFFILSLYILHAGRMIKIHQDLSVFDKLQMFRLFCPDEIFSLFRFQGHIINSGKKSTLDGLNTESNPSFSTYASF